MKKRIAGKWRYNFFRFGKCWIHVGKCWEVDRNFVVDGIIKENDGK